MHQQIYVNLPVKNLERTKSFFARLGYTFNPQFSDDKAACLILGDNLFAMLLVEPFFKTFTSKAIVDAKKTTEVLTCLSCDSRAEVDRLVDQAVAAGGAEPRPTQDLGFMYNRAFEDPDGHVWELAYMDPNAAPPQG